VQKCHQALTRIFERRGPRRADPTHVAAEVELPVVRVQKMRFLTADEVEDLAQLILSATARWCWWLPTADSASVNWPDSGDDKST
jgi:hypothetical protein